MRDEATKTDIFAPFEIWEVILDNFTIKFREPLVITPEMLPPESPTDRTYLMADLPDLSISSFGINRDELESAIRSDIRFAWQHFVLAEDSQLTADARNVKNAYLIVAEAVDG